MVTSERIQIVEATPTHAASLAARMRSDDRAEVWASDHHTPLDAVMISIRVSEFARALLIDGEAAAIWGVRTLGEMEGVYVGWLLTSDLVDRHQVTFHRVIRVELSRVLSQYPLLCNMVDARYRRSLRWLQRLGFTISEVQSFGIEALPFHFVVLRRHHADRAGESIEESCSEARKVAQAAEAQGRNDEGSAGPFHIRNIAENRLEAVT